MWLRASSQFEFFLPPWSPPVVTWKGLRPVATFIKKGRSKLSEPTVFAESATRGRCQKGETELSSPETGQLFLQPGILLSYQPWFQNSSLTKRPAVTKHAQAAALSASHYAEPGQGSNPKIKPCVLLVPCQ